MENKDEVSFRPNETIEYLVNLTSKDNFYEIFDNALVSISENPNNENFGIETIDGNREPLFKSVSDSVELISKNNFAKSIMGIISKEKFDFGEVFNANFDFYSRVFEYLIKDFNLARGTYAEYFTPQIISKIIANILVHLSPVEDTSYDIYDPCAGSGSLILHLANELGEGSFGNKAQVYTQDISAKSTRFLRVNMLLNGLTDSLDYIIKGNTLVSPAHHNIKNDPSSGVRTFDFITSNPPFKTNFSSTRELIKNKWAESEEHGGIKRFFAGIPKIKPNDKDGMEIYLCFIQHILWSLNDNGKAAIVVPTGFLTTDYSIEMEIKKLIVDNNWLYGVISMPPNIFANTNTNVSVLFIDKTLKADEIILIDAANLGEKQNSQKIVLSNEEIHKIETTFLNKEYIDKFSIVVNKNAIKEKNYILSASQYFEISVYNNSQIEIDNANFENLKNEIFDLFDESNKLSNEIKDFLDKVKF